MRAPFSLHFSARFFCERSLTDFPKICQPKSGHYRQLFQYPREPVFAARIIPL
ncbi:hypothetical protein A33K_16647 [Burkholderia humptydooensis MSMB43]|uniref:Uncharacterized protein n=1 Tax=Burkholderia humptydooensis MSMB43 TaxID=441157 RepID=A0ABN0G475_9BURK|nr:hypothetical protein A33K_16647 [Burkholderia humptydooensis MSMB43]